MRRIERRGYRAPKGSRLARLEQEIRAAGVAVRYVCDPAPMQEYHARRAGLTATAHGFQAAYYSEEPWRAPRIEMPVNARDIPEPILVGILAHEFGHHMDALGARVVAHPGERYEGEVAASYYAVEFLHALGFRVTRNLRALFNYSIRTHAGTWGIRDAQVERDLL